jgi:uncharacterized protein (TIGR02266 family)
VENSHFIGGIMSAKKVEKNDKKKGGGKKKSAAKKGGKENRDDHRIPIQLLVDYRGGEGNYLFDFCRDLGTGGVFIETRDPLDSGSNVDLTFTLPDSKETLVTSGTVIWVQGEVPGRDLTPGMGVQFSAFDADQRKQLESFVERYHATNDGGSPKIA